MAYSIDIQELEWLVIVGQRLRRLREDISMSLDYVGRTMDPPMSRSQLSRVERGESRLSAYRARQLCAVLGVSIEELLR